MGYQQETLASLRAQLQRRYESAPFWTAEEARLAINEVLRIWNLLVGAWRQRVTLPTTTAIFYTMPTGVWFPFRVAWNGRPLLLDSIVGLDYGFPNWQGQTVASGGTVPPRPTAWAPAGATAFAIWPADTVTTNALVVDGITPAPVLVAESDPVDLGGGDLGALLGMALRIVAFKEGGARFAALAANERIFYQAAANQNARFRASAFYRALMGPDPDRRLFPVRTPDQPELVQASAPPEAAS